MYFRRPTTPLTYECIPLQYEYDGLRGYAVIATCPEESDLRLKLLCDRWVFREWTPLSWAVNDVTTNLRSARKENAFYFFIAENEVTNI